MLQAYRVLESEGSCMDELTKLTKEDVFALYEDEDNSKLFSKEKAEKRTIGFTVESE